MSSIVNQNSAKQNHSGILIAAIFNMAFPDSCSSREEERRGEERRGEERRGEERHTYCQMCISEHPGFRLWSVGVYVFVVSKLKLSKIKLY
jgi:hypothetical protein